MDKILELALVRFFEAEFQTRHPEYQRRSLSKAELKQYGVRPAVMLSHLIGHHEFFVSVIPKERSLSRFVVECGWKSGESFPLWDLDFEGGRKQIREGTFDWPQENFVIRLFWLCTDRGTAEHFWDLFMEEVWNKSQESYQDFRRRTTFSATGNAMDVLETGGLTEEYGTSQAQLVGGDVLSCLDDYGIPFLQTAARHHYPQNTE